ncbi:MAG: HAMP domain-containing histidine kinase [Planctomycetaceae bacterium]|nr:HAMP domain-containing histidine kinase [Planctomycetaceae bacterium]
MLRAVAWKRRRRGGRDPRWWPLLLLLATVVLLPTACMLWMMIHAIDNERMAVRQALAELGRGQLLRLQAQWHRHWTSLAKRLTEEAAAHEKPSAAFAAIVRAELADSVVVVDGRRPAYPTLPSAAGSATHSADWSRAENLEYVARKPQEAADAYASLAQNAKQADVAARATLAQARCLVRAGRRDQAIALLADQFRARRWTQATDADGRWIVADAELRAMELIDDPTDARWQAIAARLVDRLADYSDPRMSSSQRRFLAQSLASKNGVQPMLAGAGWSLELQAAEQWGTAALESGTKFSDKPVLLPTGVRGLWQFAPEVFVPSQGPGSRRVVALYRTESILEAMRQFVAAESPLAGVDVELLPPEKTNDLARFFYAVPADPCMPDWHLGIQWNDDRLNGDAARSKIVAYVLAGSLAVSAASVLAFWVALSFRRQIQATRLKNDLVAAVSHELKTPLASIRLLVDTLLADDDSDPQRLQDYLELISKENLRLGRVIDNFLTFSRMERNKHAFTLGQLAPADVVAAAVDAAGERFHQDSCRLEVQVEPDLPSIAADADAMTTALVNLLDNAYKYTGDDKQIALRARTDGDWVFFDVTDNGIGLRRAACRRVFERFYQVDRKLSRARGGCGLGLSIVEFIVREHGGRVGVRSRLGQGSVFTVAIPRCGNPNEEETRTS